MWRDHAVFDVHGHVSPPLGGMGLYCMFLLAANSPVSTPFDDPDGPYRFDDEQWAEAVSRHVAVLDERNIDGQLIGPRPFLMFGWMAPHLLPVWTAFVNDCIARQVSLRPNRFLGACQLPQNVAAPDATHCLDELNRCVVELGFVAAYLSPDPTGRRDGAGVSSPWWDPVYARCQELDVPIIVHGTACADPRLAHVPNNYQLGFVAEQYWAAQSLGHSDVFDRFPELKVVVCHCGGALNRFIASDPHLPQRDSSSNLFYDTCAHDTAFLEAAIKQRTAAQMAFGSEAPGSGAAIRPETGRPADDLVPVIDALDTVTDDERILMFNTVPARLVPAFKNLSP